MIYFILVNNALKTKKRTIQKGDAMELKKFSEGDRLEMKKPHPCGGRLFYVEKGGSDVRLVCEKCGRALLLQREKIEKSVRKVIDGTPKETQSQ